MDPKARLPAQRHDALVELVESQRFATVRELAVATDVSEMTVRRDLEALERLGRLERVHGGARIRTFTNAEAVFPERRFAERLADRSDAKAAMARAAMRHVRDGDTVALDGSTSVVYLARELAALEVTVLTTNLLVVEALAGTGVQVLLAGGRVRGTTGTVVGPATVEALLGFQADVVCFSCTGLHAELGITEFNAEEVAVKQALLRLSPQRIGLIDASKFDRRSLSSVAPLSDMTSLVCDEPPAGALAAALAAAGVSVEVADGAAS